MNEYLTLYAIADNLAYHFISNDKAFLNEHGEIVFVKPETYPEEEKKIYKLLISIHNIFRELGESGFNILRNKYQNILNGLVNNKLYKEGFIPIFIALSILELYSASKQNKLLKIKQKTVRKRIDKFRKAAKLSLLDKSYLNSLILGEKMFYLINGNIKVKKCS